MTEVLLEYRETGREAWRDRSTTEGVGEIFLANCSPAASLPLQSLSGNSEFGSMKAISRLGLWLSQCSRDRWHKP